MTKLWTQVRFCTVIQVQPGQGTEHFIPQTLFQALSLWLNLSLYLHAFEQLPFLCAPAFWSSHLFLILFSWKSLLHPTFLFKGNALNGLLKLFKRKNLKESLAANLMCKDDWKSTNILVLPYIWSIKATVHMCHFIGEFEPTYILLFHLNPLESLYLAYLSWS